MKHTPFRAELERNILTTIRRLQRDSTVGMGCDNLRMITPPPSTLDGAIRGTNAPYFYAEMFREVCQENPTIRRFIL